MDRFDEADFCGNKSTVAPKPLASPFQIGNPFFPKGVVMFSCGQ
jgi:hypothetical protein